MTTALKGGEESASRPERSLPRERPDTSCKGGWVGPRAGLDRCGKSRPPPGFDRRTVQAEASRYTDYANRLTQEVEAPRFQDNQHMVVRLSALRIGCLYPPGNIPGTHFC
jgi:hypothetical protein